MNKKIKVLIRDIHFFKKISNPILLIYIEETILLANKREVF